MKTALTVLASVILMTSVSALAQDKGGHDIGTANTNSPLLNLTKTKNLAGYKIQFYNSEEVAVFENENQVNIKLEDGEICSGTYKIKKADTDLVWIQQLRSYVSTANMPSRAEVEASDDGLILRSDIIMTINCNNGKPYRRVYRFEDRVNTALEYTSARVGWNEIIPLTEADGHPQILSFTRSK